MDFYRCATELGASLGSSANHAVRSVVDFLLSELLKVRSWVSFSTASIARQSSTLGRHLMSVWEDLGTTSPALLFPSKTALTHPKENPLCPRLSNPRKSLTALRFYGLIPFPECFVPAGSSSQRAPMYGVFLWLTNPQILKFLSSLPLCYQSVCATYPGF